MDDALSINGFVVIKLSVPLNDKAHHFLYLKEHSVKRHHSSKPAKKTLFVCNVPQYLSKDNVKALFEQADCGTVRNVFLHDKPDTGSDDTDGNFSKFSHFFPNPDDLALGVKYAYVVFRQPDGVKKALQLPHNRALNLEPTSSNETCLKTGVQKWCDLYRHDTAEFDMTELEKEIEQFMKNYDEKKAQQEQLDKMAGEEDDGWVKVTRKRGARFTESEQQYQLQKEKKRREEKELVHFYRFQLRESRREKIADLRKRFEEDKQRIALLRQQRKFKPF